MCIKPEIGIEFYSENVYPGNNSFPCSLWIKWHLTLYPFYPVEGKFNLSHTGAVSPPPPLGLLKVLYWAEYSEELLCGNHAHWWHACCPSQGVCRPRLPLLSLPPNTVALYPHFSHVPPTSIPPTGQTLLSDNTFHPQKQNAPDLFIYYLFICLAVFLKIERKCCWSGEQQQQILQTNPLINYAFFASSVLSTEAKLSLLPSKTSSNVMFPQWNLPLYFPYQNL